MRGSGTTYGVPGQIPPCKSDRNALDAFLQARCTRTVMRAGAVQEERAELGGVVRRRAAQFRLLQHRFFGWRRIGTVIGAALAASLAYHVVFGQNGLTTFEHKRQETRELANEQHRLVRENDFYSGHVARLQTDPDAIEHQAREELHYTRPGEVIYTIPASPSGVSRTTR